MSEDTMSSKLKVTSFLAFEEQINGNNNSTNNERMTCKKPKK